MLNCCTHYCVCVIYGLSSQAGGHKQGPNLSGLFGRTAGTTEGYAYSAANKGSGE